jgi:hypothetical protein
LPKARAGKLLQLPFHGIRILDALGGNGEGGPNVGAMTGYGVIFGRERCIEEVLIGVCITWVGKKELKMTWICGILA